MGDADYFTVSKPYPLHFEWDQEKDIIKHVRWIAACIGSPGKFYAFHYKPSAPSMIIVEIEKNCSKKRETLLGEHRWKEFLLAPSEDEREYISQIFPCLHSTDLALRNDGWHRVPVRGSWFKGWSPARCEDIMHPYPTTHHCTPPIEDRTNRALCRPLPNSFLKFRMLSKSAGKPTSGASVPRAQGERVQNRGDPKTPGDPPGLRTQDDTNAGEPPEQYEDEYDEAVENIWEQNTKPTQTLPICPTHNRVCKKAICAAYDKLLKNIEKEKKDAEKVAKKKEKNRQRTKDKKSQRGGRGEEKKTDDKDSDGNNKTESATENSQSWGNDDDWRGDRGKSDGNNQESTAPGSQSWADEVEQEWGGQGNKSEGTVSASLADGSKSPSPDPPITAEVEEEEVDPWA
ncbi:hypothetical protein ARMSODRAFT_999322 [Armillaria solidipes]|uniref:Uncharacterized protein n=1 Tax=Armillaria solidipes TaxID=1076256 RepID=A0A2H3CCA9_9AGAR|nr:hypothetical protein ARMSODRAFT_999322 [Armillaria solidipes]